MPGGARHEAGAGGRCVDLGDRVFEVLHLPGSFTRQIGLWEAATATLFSGDAVYDGPLLDKIPGSDIPAYLRTMRRLETLPARVVHGGHGPSFDGARLRQLARGYLPRRLGTSAVALPEGGTGEIKRDALRGGIQR